MRVQGPDQEPEFPEITARMLRCPANQLDEALVVGLWCKGIACGAGRGSSSGRMKRQREQGEPRGCTERESEN